jgi:hypothetical protein
VQVESFVTFNATSHYSFMLSLWVAHHCNTDEKLQRLMTDRQFLTYNSQKLSVKTNSVPFFTTVHRWAGTVPQADTF